MQVRWSRQRTRISKLLKPLLVAVPRAINFGPASVTLIWKSPSVSSCSSTTRIVSSTSMRKRRGAVLFSSCDILRGRECESSWKTGGRFGLYPWSWDYFRRMSNENEMAIHEHHVRDCKSSSEGTNRCNLHLRLQTDPRRQRRLLGGDRVRVPLVFWGKVKLKDGGGTIGIRTRGMWGIRGRVRYKARLLY